MKVYGNVSGGLNNQLPDWDDAFGFTIGLQIIGNPIDHPYYWQKVVITAQPAADVPWKVLAAKGKMYGNRPMTFVEKFMLGIV